MISNQVISIEFGYSGCGWTIRLKHQSIEEDQFLFLRVKGSERVCQLWGTISWKDWKDLSEATDSFHIGTAIRSH